MSSNSSRTARLMMKMAGQSEDDGGANLGGNAGLSQLGAIPSGNNPLAMIKNKPRTTSRGPVIECSECGFTTDVPTPICVECGNQMKKQPTVDEELSYSERVHLYRERQQQRPINEYGKIIASLPPKKQYSGNSFEETAYNVMQFIKEQNPELCESQDEAADKALYNLVQSALFGFLGWKQCHK